MGQTRAFKRFRIVPLLAAGAIGYLLGASNVTGLRSIEPSASQSVALRFPLNWDEATAAAAATSRAITAPIATAGAMVMGDAQLALLSPVPMVAPAPRARQTSLQVASAEAVAPAPSNELPAEPPPLRVQNPRQARSAPATVEAKPPAAVRRHADRPGFVLDDAQIASIKQRLNLTLDQEQMWPAVEAALRNLAYSDARDARRNGATGAPQVATADPNSEEVQNLKSAAIPLIMSFNAEQKDEVRNLAHVMGLDQLASQF